MMSNPDKPYRFEECPFCGAVSPNLIADFVPNTQGNRKFIRCLECHAHGPWSTKVINEVDGWNLRKKQRSTSNYSVDANKKVSEQVTEAVVESDKNLRILIRQAAARGYCIAENSHKELDATLLEAVVDEIMMVLTPGPFLDEREARTYEDGLEEALRQISTRTNKCIGTVEHYSLHGLWMARDILVALKNPAPQVSSGRQIPDEGARPVEAAPMPKGIAQMIRNQQGPDADLREATAKAFKAEPQVETCGKLNDDIRCGLPKGTNCPDCGPASNVEAVQPSEWQRLVELAREEGFIAGKLGSINVEAQQIRPEREEAVAGFGSGGPAAHLVPERESVVASAPKIDLQSCPGTPRSEWKGPYVSPNCSGDIPSRSKATAWIAFREDHKPLHFSAAEGWRVEPVLEQPITQVAGESADASASGMESNQGGGKPSATQNMYQVLSGLDQPQILVTSTHPRSTATPRTDAEERWADWNGIEFKCVHVEFARELERELADAYKSVDENWVTHQQVIAARSFTNAELESMYHKVVMVALDCDPIPASQRADDRLEPPWEVFARMKRERDEARTALSATVPIEGSN